MTEVAAWAASREEELAGLEKSLSRAVTEHGAVLHDGRVVHRIGGGRPTIRRVYGVPLTAAVDDVSWGMFLADVLASPAADLNAVGSPAGLVVWLRAVFEPDGAALIVWGERVSVAHFVDAVGREPDLAAALTTN